MALIFGIQFFPIRVIRVIRGSSAFGIWQLRFAWDLELRVIALFKIWRLRFPWDLEFRATS